jgi:hypothetical protein
MTSFSAPRAYFYHLQLPKKGFGESWHQTAFTKKKVEKLKMKIEGIQAISILGGQNQPPPPPGDLGLIYLN